MTQTSRRSTWRGLRRKVVGTASVAALAVGGAVAVAPAANAADTPPTVTLSAPDQISNDGSTEGVFDVSIKASSDTALGNNTEYTLQLTLPDGIDACVDVTVSFTDPGSTGFPDFSSLSGTTDDQTCSYAVTATSGDDGVAAGDKVSAEFAVTVDGQVAASSTSPAKSIVGDIDAKFSVWANGAGDPAIATASTELVDNTAPTVSDEEVPAPTFGSAYNVKLITDKGFPEVTSTDIKVYGYTKDSDGNWESLDTRTAIEDNSQALINFGTDKKPHHYISLNAADTAQPADADSTNTYKSGSQRGFFLDTDTGAVVFGTVVLTSQWVDSAVQNDVRFISSPVNASGADYTWTVVADNGSKVRDDAVKEDVPAPALTTTEAASAQFNLAFPAFSDVSDSNVFKDAINALSNAGIINGYANGTFGVAQNITRDQFAAMTARLLNEVPAYTGNFISSGSCDADATPRFKDVPNASTFCQEITGLAGLGIINGTDSTHFAPNGTITRDQVAAFLYRLNAVVIGSLPNDAPQATTQFTDVPASNVFSGDIAWGASNGIINGTTSTTFDPAGKVLRQEAAGLMYRLGDTQYGMF